MITGLEDGVTYTLSKQVMDIKLIRVKRDVISYQSKALSYTTKQFTSPITKMWNLAGPPSKISYR